MSRLPVPPLFRKTDPDESASAAMSVNITQGQSLVLDAIRRHGPVTDEQLHDLLRGKISPSGARGRRAELVRAGLVVRAQRHGTTETGRACAVWAAKDAGR